ncbi:MAG: putative surface protein with fasciclin (FAS1) repeats [Nonlabens sp.]|jgi:uncharacterized surface protein with fasciclin (FAS1) repeats
MKIIKSIGIAAITASLFLVSCKDEAAEKEAAQAKIEQEIADEQASALKMEEEAKEKRDATAVNINGALMYPDMTIVENASTSKDLSTLVAAVAAAGLVETLNSEGPFTVFAPTNEAFSGLPEGTVETLLKPENKATLSGILTYHVVSGTVMAGDLLKMIEEGKGKTSFPTVNGAQLTAMVVDGKVMIKDATGATATVAIADVKQSNGVVHVIDKVLLPSK